MKVLVYRKCSTCMKALKWLEEHQVEFEERPIVEQNPTEEELREWYEKSGLPLKRFFNTSGLLYKNMKLKEKLPEMTEEEQLRLLATDGMLVKRPLVVGEDFVLTGFKEAEWQKLLADGERERKVELAERLETERLLLRPWKEEDAAELYELAKDPEVGPAAGWAPHTDAENSRQIIRDVLSEEGTYALVSKENGRILGCASLMRRNGSIPLAEDEAEIGYWIGRAYWGQGLIPEVVEEFLRYGFEELQLKQVWCMHFEGNEKSRRVQEKCGFHFQYRLENIWISALDKSVNDLVNVLTREEWEQRNRKGRKARCH